MGGDPKGGRVCWGGAGGAIPTQIMWEQILLAENFHQTGCSLLSVLYPAPAGYRLAGYDFTQGSGNVGFHCPFHEDYAGGDIRARVYAVIDNASSSDTHTYRLESRFLGNGEAVNVAFVNTHDFVIPASGTGYPMLVSDLETFTPDGTWNAGDTLVGKVTRQDTHSDTPLFAAIKIRYAINI